MRWRWRFIPACAGNSALFTPPTFNPAVHPRVCGEQAYRDNRKGGVDGSSPRVRGTGGSMSGVTLTQRFIPACAGNSFSVFHRHRAIAVHPRVCGEQTIVGVIAIRRHGSSPRVRGTVLMCQSAGIGDRFIPACAGNRQLSGINTPAKSVHPRVCGEQFLSRCPRAGHCGSSPRVRGTV